MAKSRSQSICWHGARSLRSKYNFTKMLPADLLVLQSSSRFPPQVWHGAVKPRAVSPPARSPRVIAHRESGNRARARDRRDNEGKWLLLRSCGLMDLLAWTPLTNFSRDVSRGAVRGKESDSDEKTNCFSLLVWLRLLASASPCPGPL